MPNGIEDIPFYIYDIPYVAYMDAVQRTTAGDSWWDLFYAYPETDTPANMSEGHNYWEPNGTGIGSYVVKGAPVNNMINTEIAQTDSGGRINHTNIDDQPHIWAGITSEVLTFMPQT